MIAQGSATPGSGRSRGRIGGCLVSAATLFLLVSTGPRLTITWDEAFVLGREARVRDWLRAVRDPPAFAARWRPRSPLEELIEPDGRVPPAPASLGARSALLHQPVLEWFWPFARAMPYGHPPGCAWIGLAGDWLAPSWEVLARARLGPMILVSLVSGSLFGFFNRWGFWPAVAATGAWVFQPRPFAHWHYAHFDDVLVGYWVASILAFAKAVEPGDATPARRRPRWAWAIGFGLLAAGAANTKLTGWFLPIPFAVWVVLYRDRRGLLTLLVGGIVGLIALYVLTPPWWNNPIDGVERFLTSNLTRSRSTKIPTLFLGRVILTPADSLPWYNTLVWTLFVTPVGFLGLAVAGAVRAIRRARSEPFASLAAIHWAFLLALRSLPHTPGHDGERQFLAAFGCLAIVAGLGAASLVGRFGRRGAGIVVASVAEGAISIAAMMPFLLSYYSPIVGGLPGAARLGMEPTYYWDALTDDALRWLNENTRAGEKVLFPTYPTAWRYLRQSGRLRAPALYEEPGRWAWYVLQNRPGAFSAEDRALVDSIGPRHVLVEKAGVPLIWAFPHADLERARERKRPVPSKGTGRP